MRLSKSKVALISAALLVSLLAPALLAGPLFPWSPIKPGYRAASYARAEVYFDQKGPMPEDCRDLDRLIGEAEEFHRMRFHRRVKVVVCKDWGGCQRYLPWLSVKGLGGVTLATGDVIYLTPLLKQKRLSLDEFLRHELSHAIVSQNTSIRNSLKLTDQAWFSEGLAVAFGDQRAYLSREEFAARAAGTDLADYIDPARMNRAAPGWEARFAYPAQRYFVEYLRQAFGPDRFHRFLAEYIQAPDDYRRQFGEAFGVELGEAIRRYGDAVRAREWPPEAR